MGNVQGKGVLIPVLAISLIFMMAGGNIFADESSHEKALKRLQQEGILTYGSHDLMQALPKDSFGADAASSLDFYKDLESKSQERVADTGKESLKLQGQKGGGQTAAAGRPQTEAQAPTLIDSTQYNVDVGNGSARVINNSMHRFVGFGVGGYGATQLQQAIDDSSAGDVIIIRAGEYGETNQTRFILKNGVSLLGGYKEDGTRDIKSVTSVISGYFIADNITEHTTISGFTLNNANHRTSILISNSSTALEIRNNNFAGSTISATNSGAIIDNNHFSLSGGETAIWSYNSSLSITNNVFLNPEVHIYHTSYLGVYEQEGSASIIKNNFFDNCEINIWNSYTTVENNTFYLSRQTNMSNIIYGGSSDRVKDNLIQSWVVSDPMYRDEWLQYLNWLGVINQADNTIIGESDIDPAGGKYFSDLYAGAGYSPDNIRPGYISVTPDLAASQTLAPVSGGYSDYALLQNLLRDLVRDLGAPQADVSLSGTAPTLNMGLGESALTGEGFGYFDDLVIAKGYAGLIEAARLALITYRHVAAREAMEFGIEADLEDAAIGLQLKDTKTAMDRAIFEAAQAVLAESAYIDDETMQEFTRVVIQYVRIAESVRNIIGDADFKVIAAVLTGLAEDQKRLYNDYLAQSEDVYKKLEAILGIDVAEEMLPDEYLLMPNISLSAKRKIMIDLKLDTLRNKDADDLADNENMALGIDRGILQPLRDEYIAKLKGILQIFISTIQEKILNRTPVSLRSDKTSLQAVFAPSREVVRVTK